MKNMIPISASTKNIDSHFNLLCCFLSGAAELFGAGCDGARGNGVGNMHNGWNEKFIIAFFFI